MLKPEQNCSFKNIFKYKSSETQHCVFVAKALGVTYVTSKRVVTDETDCCFRAFYILTDGYC